MAEATTKPLSAAQLMAQIAMCAEGPRLRGRLGAARAVVRVGKDKVRPIKTVGVDAGGSLVIVLEDEGEGA